MEPPKNRSFYFVFFFFKDTPGNQALLNPEYRLDYIASVGLDINTLMLNMYISAVHTHTHTHIHTHTHTHTHLHAHITTPITHQLDSTSPQQLSGKSFGNTSDLSSVIIFRPTETCFLAFKSSAADQWVKRSICSVLFSHSPFLLCLCPFWGFCNDPIQRRGWDKFLVQKHDCGSNYTSVTVHSLDLCSYLYSDIWHLISTLVFLRLTMNLHWNLLCKAEKIVVFVWLSHVKLHTTG